MAPEIILDQPYDSKCDIWSLGVVLYQMLYASHPLNYQNEQEYFEKIKSKDFEIIIDIDNDNNIRTRTTALLKKMLTIDPQYRIT